MGVPDKHYAGDSLNFRVTVPEYPPADGWSLRYRLVPRFTTPVQAPLLLSAAVDGDEYVITAAPGETATWSAGSYGWARWVEKPGVRQTLDDLESQGQLQILGDPAAVVQGFDNRTLAQKALDECRSALANAASRASNAGSSGVPVEYRIGDRMMKFDTASEAQLGLIKAVSYWQTEVNREDRRARIAAGLPDPSKLYVRM